MFTGAEGTQLRHRNFYGRHFRPAVTKAGLPPGLRFHDLRHTCVALLIAQGAHPKEIQERLGQSTIRLTFDRYGHLLPALDERLTDGLDEAFSRGSAAWSRPTTAEAAAENVEGRAKGPLTSSSVERTTGFEPATLTLAIRQDLSLERLQPLQS